MHEIVLVQLLGLETPQIINSLEKLSYIAAEHTVYGRFPESHFPGKMFPGKTFPGQSLSRKDVSRKKTLCLNFIGKTKEGFFLN